VVPRVLMVQPGPELEDAEPVIAGDGETALDLLRRERFDTVIVDLGLAPIDSWCVLATVGNWVERPRLVAIVPYGDRASEHVGRALVLGADLCMTAGTLLDARALMHSTAGMHPAIAPAIVKETQCPQPPRIIFRRVTPSGVSA
jgi:DNA-binding NarL/FixJ family response regulator